MSDTLQVPPPGRLRHLIGGAWVAGVGESAVSLNPDRPVAQNQRAVRPQLDRAVTGGVQVDAVGWAALYAAARQYLVPER